MKKLLLVLTIALAGVSCSKVPAGHVGIKVNLLGGAKGVDVEELGVGRYWIGVNEELYLFPTFEQNYSWTRDSREGSEGNESFTFQTKEGLEVGADIGISYRIDPTKASTIFTRYRKGVGEITDIYLRNHVRDALNSVASRMPVEAVYGAGKQAMIDTVEDLVKEQVGPIGINISKVYLIGSFRLPQTVIASLNAKVEATQKAAQRQNEIAQTKAESDKKIEAARGDAEAILAVAKAQAEANKILARSLTSELVEYKRIERWDGKNPNVVTGSGSGTLVTVGSGK